MVYALCFTIHSDDIREFLNQALRGSVVAFWNFPIMSNASRNSLSRPMALEQSEAVRRSRGDDGRPTWQRRCKLHAQGATGLKSYGFAVALLCPWAHPHLPLGRGEQSGINWTGHREPADDASSTGATYALPTFNEQIGGRGGDHFRLEGSGWRGVPWAPFSDGVALGAASVPRSLG